MDNGTTIPELRLAVHRLREYRGSTSRPEELIAMLYQGWYARPFASVTLPGSFPTDLVQVFRAADATSRRWDDGWIAEKVSPSGLVIARRGNEIRMAGRCDYVTVRRPGLLPGVGDTLQLSGRRDRVDFEGTWWRTAGRTWRFSRAHSGLIRLYWNYELAHLPTVIRLLTTLLSDDDRPWMLKVAAHREIHVRADAAILYLTGDAARDMAPAFVEISQHLSMYARHGAPPLSLPVQRGLAAAVDPGNNESFGQHRCRLVVESLHDVDLTDSSAAVDLVISGMRGAGIEADRPYAHRSDPLLPWEG